jgi:hypothetical protein
MKKMIFLIMSVLFTIEVEAMEPVMDATDKLRVVWKNSGEYRLNAIRNLTKVCENRLVVNDIVPGVKSMRSASVVLDRLYQMTGDKTVKLLTADDMTRVISEVLNSAFHEFVVTMRDGNYSNRQEVRRAFANLCEKLENVLYGLLPFSEEDMNFEEFLGLLIEVETCFKEVLHANESWLQRHAKKIIALGLIGLVGGALINNLPAATPDESVSDESGNNDTVQTDFISGGYQKINECHGDVQCLKELAKTYHPDKCVIENKEACNKIMVFVNDKRDSLKPVKSSWKYNGDEESAGSNEGQSFGNDEKQETENTTFSGVLIPQGLDDNKMEVEEPKIEVLQSDDLLPKTEQLSKYERSLPATVNCVTKAIKSKAPGIFGEHVQPCYENKSVAYSIKCAAKKIVSMIPVVGNYVKTCD